MYRGNKYAKENGMLKRLCPRCRRVIDDSQKYCIKCMPKIRTEADKRYDRFKRNQESKSFYNSKVWKDKRIEVLNKYLGLDLYELLVNKHIVYADTVHHIHELIEEPELALVDDNLIPLSASTHDVIHGMYKVDKVSTMKLLEAIKEKWEHNDKQVSKENQGKILEFKIGEVVYKV